MGDDQKKLVVNTDLCAGCGRCVMVAEKSFKMNDRGQSEAINPPGDDKETIQQAMDECPLMAITWEE